MRVGLGYDTHRLVEGRPLFLGGVEISYKKGLLGHSDGDALIHSVCDALLGAIGWGDIGQLFPNTDPQYKGMSSLILLKRVFCLCKERGYKLNNLDSTVIAQEPKINPYVSQMKERIAHILDIEKEIISIKATTAEGLGSLGRGEGIAAYSIVSLVKG